MHLGSVVVVETQGTNSVIDLVGADFDHGGDFEQLGSGDFLTAECFQREPQKTIAKLVAQRVVVRPGKTQELFQSTAVVGPLLLQQYGELRGREQSRAPEPVAGRGPTDTKVMSHPNHVVELYRLAPGGRTGAGMDRRPLIEHLGLPSGSDVLCQRRG